MRELDAQLVGQLGIARKQDIVTMLGEPEVKDVIGEVEVWIYRFESASKGGIKPLLKAAAEHFDELILTFDAEGILQKYTGVIRGQKSKARKQSS